MSVPANAILDRPNLGTGNTADLITSPPGLDRTSTPGRAPQETGRPVDLLSNLPTPSERTRGNQNDSGNTLSNLLPQIELIVDRSRGETTADSDPRKVAMPLANGMSDPSILEWFIHDQMDEAGWKQESKFDLAAIAESFGDWDLEQIRDFESDPDEPGRDSIDRHERHHAAAVDGSTIVDVTEETPAKGADRETKSHEAVESTSDARSHRPFIDFAYGLNVRHLDLDDANEKFDEEMKAASAPVPTYQDGGMVEVILDTEPTQSDETIASAEVGMTTAQTVPFIADSEMHQSIELVEHEQEVHLSPLPLSSEPLGGEGTQATDPANESSEVTARSEPESDPQVSSFSPWILLAILGARLGWKRTKKRKSRDQDLQQQSR